MTFAPGWYHAQGDPAGTVRAWDGNQWVGEPHPDPSAAETQGYASAVPPSAAAYEPAPAHTYAPVAQADTSMYEPTPAQTYAPVAQSDTSVYEPASATQSAAAVYEPASATQSVAAVYEPAPTAPLAKGFYYAEGDPPGTVRLWSGSEWVGFPVRDPNGPAEGSATAGVQPFVAVPGQVKLRGVAIVTQLLLIVLAGTHIFLAFSMFDIGSSLGEVGDLSLMTEDQAALAIADSIDDDTATRFGAAMLSLGGAWLISGVFFVVWFWLAYRNMSLWHRNRRGNFWAVVAWFAPFINLVRPMSMMMELLERSPRRDRQGEANPVIAMAWWLLWILPGLFIYFVPFLGDAENFGRNIFTAYGFALLVNVISVVLAIVLVQQVSNHQDSRTRPSQAQRELMRQEAELNAFKQSQSTGLVYS